MGFAIFHFNYNERLSTYNRVRCSRALAQADLVTGPGTIMSKNLSSGFGLEWGMGIGIVLVAIAMVTQAYFFTGDRLSTTGEAISRLW